MQHDQCTVGNEPIGKVLFRAAVTCGQLHLSGWSSPRTAGQPIAFSCTRYHRHISSMATSRVGMLGMRQLQQSLRRAATPPSMFRQSSIILTRTQLFSTSPVKQIFPPGPQKVRGGVNDPAPVPAPSPSHGSYHWIAERGISVAIIPLTLIPFAAGSLNPVVDAVLVSLMLLHSHLGFQ